MKNCQNGFSFDLYSYTPAKVVEDEGNSNFFGSKMFIYMYSIDTWLENWFSLVESRHLIVKGRLQACVRPAK